MPRDRRTPRKRTAAKSIGAVATLTAALLTVILPATAAQNSLLGPNRGIAWTIAGIITLGGLVILAATLIAVAPAGAHWSRQPRSDTTTGRLLEAATAVGLTTITALTAPAATAAALAVTSILTYTTGYGGTAVAAAWASVETWRRRAHLTRWRARANRQLTRLASEYASRATG